MLTVAVILKVPTLIRYRVIAADGLDEIIEVKEKDKEKRKKRDHGKSSKGQKKVTTRSTSQLTKQKKHPSKLENRATKDSGGKRSSSKPRGRNR